MGFKQTVCYFYEHACALRSVSASVYTCMNMTSLQPTHLLDLDNDILIALFDHVDIPFALRLACKTLSLLHEPTTTKIVKIVDHLNLVAWAYKSSGKERQFELASMIEGAAAHSGNIATLDWLRTYSSKPISLWHTGFCAARGGQVPTLQYLTHYIGSARSWPPGVAAIAATSGKLGALQWLHDQKAPMEQSNLTKAASNGHLDIVRYLLDSNYTLCMQEASVGAAKHGHLGVLRQLGEDHRIMGTGWKTPAAVVAAARGHRRCMAYAITWTSPNYDREDCIEQCMQTAAYNGHCEILSWLIDAYNATIDETICMRAARTGQLSVFKLAKTKGFAEAYLFSKIVFFRAEMAGHLNVLEWLVDEEERVDFPRARSRVQKLERCRERRSRQLI